MKISFLVTYYNQKEYVRRSIDSILAIDKPRDWEILVGDDGSVDGTVDEVYQYIATNPDHIKLYIMPRECGEKTDPVKRASANRLNLLEHAEGDCFCTLDGDDYFCDTDFVKEAISIFEANEDISVISYGYRYVTDGIYGKCMTLPNSINNKRVDKINYLEKYYLPAGAFVYRNSYGKDRINFLKCLGFFDDNDIVINSLAYGEMFAVNRAIYAYQQTGKSVYTGMNSIEQAVLNVLGMDVDLQIVGDSLKPPLMKRYSSAVILMYIWRNSLKKILGEEKYVMYDDESKNYTPSYCRDILHYDDLNDQKKKKIRAFLALQKKYTLVQYSKYFFGKVR